MPGAVICNERIKANVWQFSAISSAKIIRHAVSIDERRAKFRADLVSHGVAAAKDTNKPLEEQMEKNPHPHHDWIHRSSRYKPRRARQKLSPLLKIGWLRKMRTVVRAEVAMKMTMRSGIAATGVPIATVPNLPLVQ